MQQKWVQEGTHGHTCTLHGSSHVKRNQTACQSQICATNSELDLIHLKSRISCLQGEKFSRGFISEKLIQKLCTNSALLKYRKSFALLSKRHQGWSPHRWEEQNKVSENIWRLYTVHKHKTACNLKVREKILILLILLFQIHGSLRSSIF